MSAEPLPIERPLPSGANAPAFGSDVIAETLRALDIPYIALNPGASYRGLHDSLVNYLGNSAPQMLLCLHEESAVAIAHGYAKVTGKAMAAAVHSNVGLMHATMAIFNAWCDRMPMLVLGATGPVDAAKRRPWIDWIHTARDQGALIRPYTKWDDQPASPAAAREALLRARWIAETVPMGPVYVNLDAEMQEAALAEPLPPLDAGALRARGGVGADRASAVTQAAALLKAAQHPVMLIGRASRSLEAWNARVRLAEAIGARVITDLKVGASFPTDHPLHLGAPSVLVPDAEGLAALGKADVILSLDWVDLAGTLKAAKAPAANAKVISVTIDHQAAQRLEHGPPGFRAGRPDARRRSRTRRAAAGRRRSAEARRRPPRAACRTKRPCRRARSRSSISRARCATRSARARARSRICRSPGTARGGRSATRSTSSAPTAAAGSAPVRASRSARRSRCKEPGGCRSASAATATS